jgi:hypothetical protein
MTTRIPLGSVLRVTEFGAGWESARVAEVAANDKRNKDKSNFVFNSLSPDTSGGSERCSQFQVLRILPNLKFGTPRLALAIGYSLPWRSTVTKTAIGSGHRGRSSAPALSLLW